MHVANCVETVEDQEIDNTFYGSKQHKHKLWKAICNKIIKSIL